MERRKKKEKEKREEKTQTKAGNKTAYFLIPVQFEIDGSFIGYIKFKRALSLSNKMLNFDKESISVVKGDTTGAIKVKGTLTIVGLPDEFFRIVILTLISLFFWSYSFADSHDTEQNIIEKAKEINKQIKIKQAKSQANISSEINNEEPLPLNDPFAGDGSLTGGNQVVMNNSEDPKSHDELI